MGSNNQVLHHSSSSNHLSSMASSTTTVVAPASTPSYPDYPPFIDAGICSPIVQQQTGLSVPGAVQTPYGNYQQANSNNGSGVMKSDSMNSGTSAGSARVGRRKRGSNASGSGTSSNSGSRPNSNVDISDSLEAENETLKNQLQLALRKLKKYEQVSASAYS